MSDHDVVRAWKDRRYRQGLPATERMQVPASPAGAVELPEDLLEAAGGGTVSVLACPISLIHSICVCWITPVLD